MLKTLALIAILTLTTAFTQIKYEAVVVEVTDGDTIVVHIEGFPAPFDPVAVRFNGIDTPESRLGLKGAKCAREKEKGLAVKAWMKEKLPAGTKVTVVWSGIHEMYGRLLGTVIIKNEDLSKTLIDKGYAVPYFGKTKVKDWCKK
jgi:endonuclease YncB( thermonuclease family)